MARPARPLKPLYREPSDWEIWDREQAQLMADLVAIGVADQAAKRAAKQARVRKPFMPPPSAVGPVATGGDGRGDHQLPLDCVRSAPGMSGLKRPGQSPFSGLRRGVVAVTT